MTEVFYRKWRPGLLSEVVGQESLVKTLRNAVSQGRTAHAYLFCGPRGTGKTSTARILAKAVNCRAPQSGEPDDKCDLCLAVNQSRSLDLIEIDGASNRGIDDIRALREKVNFVPNEGVFKVYIIDEVHMLTEAAFNALLKTLEEPPPHVIFILATTEAHKVPLTIISRCQRFDFKRIPQKAVISKLTDLCSGEGVEVADEALSLIARVSSGSLRDAENVLEQALVSYGSPLTEEHLRDLLQMGDQTSALHMMQHVLERDVKKGLALINKVAASGSDLRQFHRALIEYLRAALIFKTDAESSIGYPTDTENKIQEMCDSVKLEQLVNTIKTFTNVEIKPDNLFSLDLELALVESAAQSITPTVVEQSTERRSLEQTDRDQVSSVGNSADKTHVSNKTTRALRPTRGTNGEIQSSTQERIGPAPSDPQERLDYGWDSLINALRMQKGRRFNIGALLRSCISRDIVDDTVVMQFTHRSHMERMQEELENPETKKMLSDALFKIMEARYDIKLAANGNQDNAPDKKVSQHSHLVRAAQSMGATVIGEKAIVEEENTYDEQ